MTYNLDSLTPQHRQFYNTILPKWRADVERELARVRTSARHIGDRSVQLGLRATHHPTIALGDHLAAQAEPPAHCHRGLFRGYSDVLSNDMLGSCGPCAAIHGTEGINHAAGNPIPPFTRQDSILFYSEEAGYQPDNPSTDQGTDNAVMVQHWTDTGILCSATGDRHQIVGTVFVDPADDVQNRIAIVEFGALFRAFNMPQSAQGQRRWDVTDPTLQGNAAPGSWGGHDVVAMAYDPDSLDYDSWGEWIPTTTAFERAYALQGFVVLTREMLGRRGVSPTGLDWSSLNAAFGKLVPSGSSA